MPLNERQARCSCEILYLHTTGMNCKVLIEIMADEGKENETHQLDDPLEKICVIDFRNLLKKTIEDALFKESVSKGTCPRRILSILRLKILVLQRFYNLSDD